jgi:hypothetical protein
MALACLMLGVGAPGSGDEIVYINQKGFTIPISVKPERRADVRELVLYLSRDQGRTWEIHGRTAPDRKGFDYFANSDGLVWFSIAVIDKQGKQDPPDPYRAEIGQKICIDTVKPAVKIVSADRVGSEVQVAWEVREDHPEWTSLKLEYHTGDQPGGPWTPLMVQPGERGNLRFKADSPGPITVRLSMRDLAGNEGADERQMGGGPAPDRSLASSSNIQKTGGPESSNIRQLGGADSVPPPPAPVTPAPITPLAGSGPPPAPGTAPMPTRGALPPLQIVNKRQVKLGFSVGRIGPSGLGNVDVYVTTDEGATWEKAPADSNPTLPVTGEARGVGPVQGSVTVSLPRDGVIYGFCLVVKSRAGLGKQPPRAGDPPHVRIEVDTMPPDAKLFAPVPDPTRSDRLVLSWEAKDRNLAPNPVSLEWAASPQGPWSFIGDPQLPNTGRYSWQVPDNTPAKVYLRLSVRDSAGNNAIAQTDQPVIIDVIIPEAGDVKVQQ